MSSIVHSTSDQPVGASPLPKASPPDSVPEATEPPITSLLSETGKPYLAKHLDADMTWESLPEATKENGQLIEEQFLKSVKSGKYAGDKVAYQDFMRHYENVTNTRHSPLATKINLIAEFIRYSQRKAQYEP